MVLDPGSGTYGIRDLLVSGELLQAMAPSLAPFASWRTGGAQLAIYDLRGCYVFPGLVDIHTHLRVPGQEHKEDLRSGTLAAAAGGFTTVVAMPNTEPPLDRVSVLRKLRKEISEQARVRVELVAAVSQGRKGRKLAKLASLRRAGAVGFSDDGSPLSPAALMRAALQVAKDLGCPVISHCEDLSLAGAGVIHEGAVAEKLGLAGIPGSAEEVMVARDLCLAADIGAHLHLAHLSTARSLEMAKAARDRGLCVTTEVTPHHLVLTEEAVLRCGADAKVNPPLRTDKDRQALQQGLRDGIIDAVASDHAPHHPAEKALSIQEAPFGVIGFETTTAVVMSLVKEGKLGLVRAVELLTSGPAAVLGLGCGRLEVGGKADLVVFDPNAAYEVDVESFFSKARNCPFAGWRMEGRAVCTLVGGEVVWQERDFARRLCCE